MSELKCWILSVKVKRDLFNWTL